MTEKPDFLELIPPGLPTATASTGPCGSVSCEDGWIWAPGGAARCPICQAASSARRLALQYACAGVEGTLYDLEWADMRLRHESWRLAKALGENIAAIVEECINVVMIGPKGRGKTQAGVLLAKDATMAGYAALVVNWAQWVDQVQSDYTRRARTQAEHVADVVRPRLLVLDEVGGAASREGEIERKLFTRVIGARYNARRPTVMTANLKRAELEAALGEWAFDRIQHACQWMVFDGPSERAEVEASRVQETLERIRKAAGL